MIGDIMRISRLRMGTDGKGITTLVAFFDCPLKCKYCINPQCHDYTYDITHEYDFEQIRASYTPKQLAEVLEKDEIYYLMTGGGVTFGGGEPLLQSAFIHEVCKLLNPKIKIRIETSLNVPWRYVEPILDDIDEWIIDIKDMNPEIYKRYTGMNIDSLLENLFKLAEIVDLESLHIRIPKIPNYNTDEDIKKSVKDIEDCLCVEPEVFEYSVLPHTDMCDKKMLRRFGWYRENGEGGSATLIEKDDTKAVFAYGCYNMKNIDWQKNIGTEDGKITIQLDALIKPIYARKSKRISGVKTKIIKGYQPVYTNGYELLNNNKMKVVNASGTWETPTDGIDIIAIEIASKIASMHYYSGEIPSVVNLNF